MGAAPEADWPAGTSGTEAVLDGTVAFEGWVRHEDAHGEYFLSRRSYAADELPWQVLARSGPGPDADPSPCPSPNSSPSPDADPSLGTSALALALPPTVILALTLTTAIYYGYLLPQLFIDDVPLTPARWPNAAAWTPEWWDRDLTWARQADTARRANLSTHPNPNPSPNPNPNPNPKP